MASKASGKHYVSKSERANVSRKTTNGMKTMLPSWSSFMDKFDAYTAGRGDPWFTVANPNKTETNKKMIKVKGSHLFGPSKDRKGYMIKGE